MADVFWRVFLLSSDALPPSCLLFQRLIQTAPWGDDPAAIEQQLVNHQKFHNSIQRSAEVDRARDELVGHSEEEEEEDALQLKSIKTDHD